MQKPSERIREIAQERAKAKQPGMPVAFKIEAQDVATYLDELLWVNEPLTPEQVAEAERIRGVMLNAAEKAIRRNESTPEGKAFWQHARQCADECEGWPDSKRAGINVSTERGSK